MSSKFHLPWLTQNNAINYPKKADYNKARKLKTDVSEFRRLRRSLDRQIRKAHWSYVSKIIVVGPVFSQTLHQNQLPTVTRSFSITKPGRSGNKCRR